MMSVKYKEYYEKMVADHADLFDQFTELHTRFAANQEAHQAEFNALGDKVMAVVREYEDRLCRQSEKGGFGVFSGGLAEKFQNEVRKHFPLIDYVGVRLAPAFVLKKINL